MAMVSPVGHLLKKCISALCFAAVIIAIGVYEEFTLNEWLLGAIPLFVLTYVAYRVLMNMRVVQLEERAESEKRQADGTENQT